MKSWKQREEPCEGLGRWCSLRGVFGHLQREIIIFCVRLKPNLTPGEVWGVEYWKAQMRWRESHSYLSRRWWGEATVASMMEERKTLPRETGKEDRGSVSGSKHLLSVWIQKDLGFTPHLLFSRLLTSSIHIVAVSLSVKWESKYTPQRFVGGIKWGYCHESIKYLAHTQKVLVPSFLPSFLLPSLSSSH